MCSRDFDSDVAFCPRDGTALISGEALVGTVVDNKYRIEGPVGSGGMGQVYRATQLNLERTVALKVMRGDYVSDPSMAERFKREALAAGRLNHPNIVTVYDFGIVPDVGAYMAMELLEGRTLRQELVNRGRLDFSTAVSIMKQICSAVNAAHEQGVIHRDLKPANIFISPSTDGGPPRVKILDFGVAKLRNDGAIDATELTATGAVIGTPVYMSPEQCVGEEIDPRSDIYALGCVFFEIVAGRPPFTGATSSALVVQHASEAPPKPSAFLPGIPAGLENALLRALAKSPADRYQTAAELGVAIASAWTGRLHRPPDQTIPFGGPSSAPEMPEHNSSPDLVEQLFSTPAPRDSRRALAVLPFANVTGDPAVDFLATALTDRIVAELSPEPSLLVRPSSAAARFRGVEMDPRVIGTALEVALIVSGSYLKEGSTVQCSMQLVDVERNEVVWQQRLSTEYTDAISLQEEVATRLGSELMTHITPTPEEQNSLSSGTDGAAPIDPVAVALVEEAAELGTSAADRASAIERLERAVALEPDFAEAWVALAGRHYDAGTNVHKGTDHVDRAMQAAERALALDTEKLYSDLAVGRLLVEAGRAEEVARAAAAAVAARPDAYAARFALGYALRFGGLLDAAQREIRASEPFVPKLAELQIATIYFQKQPYEDTRRVLGEVGSEASSVPALFLLTMACVLSGDLTAAREATGNMIRTDPECLYTLLGRIAVRHSEELDVGPLLEWCKTVEVTNGETCCWLAELHALAGDLPVALAWLRSAVARGYFNAPHFESSPMLAPLRELEEAAPILAEARQRHEAFAATFASN
jgi:serine/threonine-protein kinase